MAQMMNMQPCVAPQQQQPAVEQHQQAPVQPLEQQQHAPIQPPVQPSAQPVQAQAQQQGIVPQNVDWSAQIANMMRNHYA